MKIAVAVAPKEAPLGAPNPANQRRRSWNEEL